MIDSNTKHQTPPFGGDILLAGCGKMGSALCTRWRDAHVASIEIIDPGQANAHKDLASLPAHFQPEVVAFAVKPQQLANILPEYKKRFGAKPLYISIAAGKTLGFFTKYMGTEVRIVRAMPNTPAMIGKGVTVLAASSFLSAADKKTATQLMEAVGSCLWAEESLMDAVTAISGSGPAYVFLFLESLVKAGIAAGLPQDMAQTLVLETMAGSCSLAAASNESFAQLRQNVTSPGGTTEAALKVLTQNNALEMLVKDAVLAAKNRSKELAE